MLKEIMDEIKMILSSKFFWFADIIFLILMSLIFLSQLPFETTFNIGSYSIGPLYVNILLLGASIISLYLTEGLKKRFDRVRGLYSSRKYIVKTIALIFVNFIIYATFFPLGLIVCSTASLNFIQLYYLLFYLLIAGVGFGWIGLFIKGFLSEVNREYFSAAFQVIWAIVLLISYFQGVNKLYINIIPLYSLLVFSFLLFIILLIKSHKQRTGGVDN